MRAEGVVICMISCGGNAICIWNGKNDRREHGRKAGHRESLRANTARSATSRWTWGSLHHPPSRTGLARCCKIKQRYVFLTEMENGWHSQQSAHISVSDRQRVCCWWDWKAVMIHRRENPPLENLRNISAESAKNYFFICTYCALTEILASKI